ncbi:MAG: glycosyltransferase N-terminal domain-containing protein [Vampirovibrionales bacterium]
MLYNAFINATLLLGLPLWLVLLACKPKWRAGLAQKLGIYHPRLKAQLDRLPAHRRVWIHAVSVGELNAAAPLIDSLLGQQIPVIISTTTATGQARAAALSLSTRSVLPPGPTQHHPPGPDHHRSPPCW